MEVGMQTCRGEIWREICRYLGRRRGCVDRYAGG